MNLFDALAFERDVPEFVRKAGEFITKYSLAQETINRWWGRALVWAECYTKECIRLGIVSTQRAETNHAALKWHIEATSHLNVLVSTVDNMIYKPKKRLGDNFLFNTMSLSWISEAAFPCSFGARCLGMFSA